MMLQQPSVRYRPDGEDWSSDDVSGGCTAMETYSFILTANKQTNNYRYRTLSWWI